MSYPVRVEEKSKFALFGTLIAVVCLFIVPLKVLFSFALNSDLYSHVLLVPAVSLYFVWIGRKELEGLSGTARSWSVIAVAAAVAIFATSQFGLSGAASLSVEDRVSGPILAFVFSIVGACAWWLGKNTIRRLAFALGFLLFMVPFPTPVREAIETFYQHTSAATAAAFFTVVGTPFFRDATFFQLPGINLQVAPECSGIRSSLALFITSIVAGQLFLRSRRKRVVLALAVIPLGILRNGLRVFTIGEMCVHLGPEMIDSPVHHRGGPLFFALSLIPFGIFLFVLIKSDRKKFAASVKETSPRQPVAAKA